MLILKTLVYQYGIKFLQETTTVTNIALIITSFTPMNFFVIHICLKHAILYQRKGVCAVKGGGIRLMEGLTSKLARVGGIWRGVAAIAVNSS